LLKKVTGLGREDMVAASYGWETIHSAQPSGAGMSRPAPTVWDCRSLATKPWFDEQSEVKNMLEKNASAIVAEYEGVQEHMKTHPDNDEFADSGKWNGLFFTLSGGKKNEKLCALCPETTKVIESLPLCPNYGFVMFSELAPGTHLLAHTGSSNFRLRYHLGIRVPEQETVKLRVAYEERSWSEGKCIVFDDAYEHEVKHTGEQPRVVLIVDAWHPSLTAEDIQVLEHPVFQTFGRWTQSE